MADPTKTNTTVPTPTTAAPAPSPTQAAADDTKQANNPDGTPQEQAAELLAKKGKTRGKDKLDRELYELRVGKHVYVNDAGEVVTAKVGEMVPLTPKQLEAFGDKFVV